jgi:hypothetical protein
MRNARHDGRALEVQGSDDIDNRRNSAPAPGPATHPVPVRGEPVASHATDNKRIAVFNDYPGFLAALRLRAAELQVATSGPANAVAGLPDKYLQKILGPRPIRRIGMGSLAGVLQILATELWLVADPKAFQRFTSRVPKRDERLVRTTAKYVITRTRRHYQKIGRIGGRKRRNKMPPADRVLASRKAANARWANTTVEQRSDIGRNLVRARWRKRGRAARGRRND